MSKLVKRDVDIDKIREEEFAIATALKKEIGEQLRGAKDGRERAEIAGKYLRNLDSVRLELDSFYKGLTDNRVKVSQWPY